MLPRLQLEPQAETPLYMQIYEHISSAILLGTLAPAAAAWLVPTTTS
jgi:DNA-binding transcriptional regulator YhcF (GntR family)